MFYLFKQIAEVENLFYGRLFTFSVSGKVTKSSVVRIFLLFNFVLFRAVGISLNYHLAMQVQKDLHLLLKKKKKILCCSVVNHICCHSGSDAFRTFSLEINFLFACFTLCLMIQFQTKRKKKQQKKEAVGFIKEHAKFFFSNCMLTFCQDIFLVK